MAVHIYTQGNEMKKIFRAILDIFESMGRAKAAAELSRAGYYKEAQALMLKK